MDAIALAERILYKIDAKWPKPGSGGGKWMRHNDRNPGEWRVSERHG